MTDTAAPRTGTTTRRLIPALAAVLVLIAAGLGWALTRPSAPPAPPWAPPAAPPSTTAEGRTVDLTVAGGADAKCAEPEPERLRTGTDFAFAGTVTGIAGDTVTLAVTRVYRGAAASRVTVTQTDEATEQLLGATRFRDGENYLIASADGAVLICGYTGAADTPQLIELYERAF